MSAERYESRRNRFDQKLDRFLANAQRNGVEPERAFRTLFQLPQSLGVDPPYATLDPEFAENEQEKRQNKNTGGSIDMFHTKKYKETSSLELVEGIRYLGLTPIFRGMCLRDTLPQLKEVGLFIINLDSAAHSHGGTHWVALATTEDEAVYFDSFGCAPPLEVWGYMKRFWGAERSMFNDWQCQDVPASSCGFWALLFCAEAGYHKGKLSNAIRAWLSKFVDSTTTNESMLHEQLANWTK